MTIYTSLKSFADELDQSLIAIIEQGQQPPRSIIELRSQIANVLNEGSLSNSSPGGTSGGAYNSAFLEEIKTAIGSKHDQTAFSISSYYSSNSYSLVSLIRGIFSYLASIMNGYSSIFVRTATPVHITPLIANIYDHSGTVENENTSFIAIHSPSRNWLMVQNLGVFNPEKKIYEGDLWINIGYEYDPDTYYTAYGIKATAGPGSYKLSPGATLSLEGSSSPFGVVALLGTIEGIKYTLKECTSHVY